MLQNNIFLTKNNCISHTQLSICHPHTPGKQGRILEKSPKTPTTVHILSDYVKISGRATLSSPAVFPSKAENLTYAQN